MTATAKLPGADSDATEPGPGTELLTIRVPAQLLKRAEALVGPALSHPEFVGYGRSSRSAVIRNALAAGLEIFERKLLE